MLQVKSVADLEGGAPSSPPKTYIPERQSCYSSGCDGSMAREENCIMRAVSCCGGSFTLSSCTSRLEKLYGEESTISLGSLHL